MVLVTFYTHKTQSSLLAASTFGGHRQQNKQNHTQSHTYTHTCIIYTDSRMSQTHKISLISSTYTKTCPRHTAHTLDGDSTEHTHKYYNRWTAQLPGYGPFDYMSITSKWP